MLTISYVCIHSFPTDHQQVFGLLGLGVQGFWVEGLGFGGVQGSGGC